MKIQTVSFRNQHAPEKFLQSLRDTGFAVLKDHPIDLELLDSLYTGWQKFFLSTDKHRYRVDPEETLGSQEGYYPPEESETAVGQQQRDLKEYYHVIWNGIIPPALNSTTRAYRDSALSLGAHLLRWIQNTLPGKITRAIPKPLHEVISAEASLLRVLHYPPLSGEEAAGAVRAAPHEDINLITLLPASQEPGLQVLDTHGSWHMVSTDAMQLVVNAGDMLSELTGGYLPSTTHRVVNPGPGVPNRSRISAPFFLTPDLDLRLSDRYTAGSYLQERLRQITR